MGNPAKKFATYDDLWGLPPHMQGQILNGELIAQPRPALKHALAASRLGGKLFNPFDSGDGGPGGWIILIEPELHLLGDVIVPDLAGWKKSRLPQLPDTAYSELAPDWVCEVLSPSTANLDRKDKMRWYAQVEVNHLWLIDPANQTLEAYQRQEQQWLLLQTLIKDDAVSVAPFDAITFDLAVLWNV